MSKKSLYVTQGYTNSKTKSILRNNATEAKAYIVEIISISIYWFSIQQYKITIIENKQTKQNDINNKVW